MESVALGVVVALAASALFNAGLLIEARRTRAIPPEEASGAIALLRRLVKDRVWLFGVSLDVLALPLHAVALLLAPVTVVQPTLAAGLLILLAAGRRSGHAATRREVGGVLAVIAGVTGVALLAPERSAEDGGLLALGLTLGVLGLVIAATALLGLRRGLGAGSSSAAAMIAAGLAYALSSVELKLMSNELSAGAWAAALAWLLAVVLTDGFGLTREMQSLQRRPATQVGPMIFALPVIVPVLLAPFLFGEDWAATPGHGLPLGLSVLATAAGAAVLAGSPMVAAATPSASADPGASLR